MTDKAASLTSPNASPVGKKLNPNCKKQLQELTRDAFGKFIVKNGTYLHDPSTNQLFHADKVLPSQGAYRTDLNSYISETPFFDFIRESLSRELSERGSFQSGEVLAPLNVIPGFEDTDSVADRLVDDFESLPWKYELTLPLPDAIGKPMWEALGPTDFSGSIRLVALDEAFKERYSAASGNEKQFSAGGLAGLLAGHVQPQWPAVQTALQVTVFGFVGHFATTEPVREALSTIESFFGLCVALNLFTISPTFHPAQPRVSAFIHRVGGAGAALERKYPLDAAQSQMILELKLTSVVDRGTALQRRGYFGGVSFRIQSIFSDANLNRQMISAAKWLLNSHIGNDALLSFVQATVVLEILLGEQQGSDKIGLTELLRNRCAYLVAKNREEREEIKATFNEIYDVRSKIVHTGKSKLSNREYFLLTELRRLGHLVIAKEIDLLLANEAK